MEIRLIDVKKIKKKTESCSLGELDKRAKCVSE